MITLCDEQASQTFACHVQGRTQGGIKGFIPPSKLPKLDLTTDAEYVANLVTREYVVVNGQQYSLLHGYVIPAQRHFFLLIMVALWNRADHYIFML